MLLSLADRSDLFVMTLERFAAAQLSAALTAVSPVISAAQDVQSPVDC